MLSVSPLLSQSPSFSHFLLSISCCFILPFLPPCSVPPLIFPFPHSVSFFILLLLYLRCFRFHIHSLMWSSLFTFSASLTLLLTCPLSLCHMLCLSWMLLLSFALPSSHSSLCHSFLPSGCFSISDTFFYFDVCSFPLAYTFPIPVACPLFPLLATLTSP